MNYALARESGARKYFHLQTRQPEDGELLKGRHRRSTCFPLARQSERETLARFGSHVKAKKLVGRTVVGKPEHVFVSEEELSEQLQNSPPQFFPPLLKR